MNDQMLFQEAAEMELARRVLGVVMPWPDGWLNVLLLCSSIILHNHIRPRDLCLRDLELCCMLRSISGCTYDCVH